MAEKGLPLVSFALKGKSLLRFILQKHQYFLKLSFHFVAMLHLSITAFLLHVIQPYDQTDTQQDNHFAKTGRRGLIVTPHFHIHTGSVGVGDGGCDFQLFAFPIL